MISMGEGRSSDRQVYEDALADARLADRLGFEAFWFAEHHFNGDFCMSPSPNLLVASAARETERIKLGVAVNVLPMHHPVRLAEEGAMLDQLTNGRFMWGIGRGIVGREFLPFGVDSANARARFNEIHDTVINAWTTGRIECHGRFYDFEGVDLYPNVMQRPHPPVWAAAQSPESVAWCARHDYIAMQVGEPMEQARRHAERYRRAAAEAGVTIREGGIIPDRSGYEYWYEEGDLSRYATDDYDLLNQQGIIVCGSPQTVIEHLRRQAMLVGTDRFLLDFWRGSLAREDRMRSLELFGNEVIPALRGGPIPAAA
jgi:alkanesulfonate monooxygenase SsuD/methylene tetrahydromethanopterin reductase-like flavin-dependent oxidoreductase (luciferase family)